MFGPVLRAVEDEELIRQVAEGDDRALSELYDRYSRPVYATGIRVLGDASLAEELVQDAFTSVWRRDLSTRVGRVSRPGSTGSPATGLWISIAGGRYGPSLPARSRFETCQAALSPREGWTVGTSPGRSRASPMSIGKY